MRAGHQRPADREHLLLAAGHRARLLVLALLQAREQVEDALEVLADPVVAAAVGAHVEVLADGHPREAVASLRREGDPAADDLLRRDAGDLLALEA